MDNQLSSEPQYAYVFNGFYRAVADGGEWLIDFILTFDDGFPEWVQFFTQVMFMGPLLFSAMSVFWGLVKLGGALGRLTDRLWNAEWLGLLIVWGPPALLVLQWLIYPVLENPCPWYLRGEPGADWHDPNC